MEKIYVCEGQESREMSGVGGAQGTKIVHTHRNKNPDKIESWYKKTLLSVGRRIIIVAVLTCSYEWQGPVV